MPAVLAVGRLRQEDCYEFTAALSYRMSEFPGSPGPESEPMGPDSHLSSRNFRVGSRVY